MSKQKVFVIAEAGVNHNGSLERAIEMVEAAHRAGADAVKFQTFKASELVTEKAPTADYQKKNLGDHQISQFEMLKKLELSYQDFKILKSKCDQLGILFMSTPFDGGSADFLYQLDQRFFKISSGDFTNLPLLSKIISFGRPMILSTGMSEWEEVLTVVDFFKQKKFPLKDLTFLHCHTDYPTQFKDVHLLAMEKLKQLGVQWGYSDHTLGLEIPWAATALGAQVIEKHFTLDKNLPGPDHLASLDAEELKLMVQGIRRLEQALSGEWVVSEQEKKNRLVARKSLVASCSIAKGDLFNEKNLTTKRPGSGMSPLRWQEILGTPAERDYQKDDLI